MKARLGLLALLTLTAGCAVGPDYVEPPIETAPSFAGAAGDTVSSEQVKSDWWKSFSDPVLENLIDAAVSDNKNLHAALARVNQSRALRRQAFLDLLPTVTTNGGYTKARTSGERSFGGVGQDGTAFGGVGQTFEVYDAGFDAFWELDLFGRVRRNVESRNAASEASVADLQDVIRVLVADVARSYFELRGYQGQLKVARENSETQAQVVKVADALFKGGQTTEFDVLRAQAQQSETLATIPTLEANERATMFRLAVLTGKQPHELISQLTPTIPFPEYRGPVTISDPGSMLRRRPDVKAAERRLAAATAGIGVAEGDYFPKFTFNGSISVEASESNRLFSGNGEAWSFGPQFSWAAFDLGRVLARVDASKASTQEALAQYEQSVLTALQDTETALVNYASARRRRDYLRQAVDQSQKAVNIARTQYENGLIDLLPVLDSQRTILSTQAQLTNSETDLLTALVGVFKALGSEWSEPKSDGEVTKPIAAPAPMQTVATAATDESHDGFDVMTSRAG